MSKRGAFILISVIVLFIGTMIFSAFRYKAKVDESEKRGAAKEKRKEDSIKAVQDIIDKQLLSTDSLLKKRQYDSVIKICDHILEINSKSAKAYFIKGKVYRLKKKYEEAQKSYSSALDLDKTFGEAFYERALCFVKAGKKQNAVSDLKQAIDLNFKKADSLYEKINPLKKRISGSHCLCRDGSISNSSGRGACSHHGGVSGIEYEYETYREY